MTRQPVGVPRNATLREVARELADDEIGAVPVLGPGGPVGLISERDLIGAVAAGDDLDDRQVADLMSTDLVTARPGDTIGAVAALMDDAGVRHILVADGATGGRRGLRPRRPRRPGAECVVNGGVALAPGPARRERAGRLVVLTEAADLPGWVHAWSHEVGWPLRAAATTPGHRSSPGSLLAEVAALVADPVLVVPRDVADVGLSEVTAAIHDLPDDAPVLAAAADVARHLDAPLIVTQGLPISFAERSVGLQAALEYAHRLLDAAAQRLVDDFPDVHVVTRLVRAHPYELVGEDADTGLLVLGGPRRQTADVLGLVARSALHHVSCPILLVPR
jgi:CBS domain-containing protein